MSFLDTLPERILIISHSNPDLDAICSSIALKEAIRLLHPSSVVVLGTPVKFSTYIYNILREFSEKLAVKPAMDVDAVILVDTSTLQQVAPLDSEIKKYKKKKAVIDHHTPHKSTEKIADIYIVDDTASSTSELLYGLIRGAGLKINSKIGEALLLGILSDSSRLRFASPDTIKIVSEILDAPGVDYRRVQSLLEVPEDISRKIAHLKSASRMKLHRVGDFLVVTTEVGSFNSSVAKALITLGADCAFVGTKKKDEVQISARADEKFIRKTGLNLGRDIMREVGQSIDGEGGGHAGAAGAMGKSTNLSETLKYCVRLVKEFLGAH